MYNRLFCTTLNKHKQTCTHTKCTFLCKYDKHLPLFRFGGSFTSPIFRNHPSRRMSFAGNLKKLTFSWWNCLHFLHDFTMHRTIFSLDSRDRMNNTFLSVIFVPYQYERYNCWWQVNTEQQLTSSSSSFNWRLNDYLS